MKAFIVRTLLILVSLVLLVQLWIFGSLVWWRTHPVESTMMMRLDYWSAPSKPIKHEWRDYDQISDYVKHAVVAAEDGKFLQHHGFDWEGMQFALERNKDKGKVVAGGSTISQQLAKNLFLYNKRSFIRKGQEAVATWMMERMWSKQRILEVFTVWKRQRSIILVKVHVVYRVSKLHLLQPFCRIRNIMMKIAMIES